MLFGLLNAQNLKTGKVFGYVVDDSTGLPLENVNVFISNTIYGASTNGNGYFEIEHVPVGNHELVAAMVGYYSDSKMVTVTEKSKYKVRFGLDRMMYSLEEAVVVEAERPYKWLNDLKKFKSKLFGEGDFAAECSIENSELLDFEWSEGGIMTAKAKGPLKIKNKALGYDIQFVLVNYYWQPKTGKLRYVYRIRFKPMNSDIEDEKRKWEKNRKRAYEGSLRHFLSCLYNNSLEENGFRVFNVKETNPKKPLHPKNMLRAPYEFLLTPTMIPGEKMIHFEHYLKIVYTREAEFSSQNIEDAVIVKEKPQVSWLKLNAPNVFINQFGHTDGIVNFELFGYWSRSGVAEMVPKYYVPESE